VHLHDNDTTADQHRLPFAGTVDWQRLCAILAVSSYDRCVSMEVSMRSDAWQSEEVFLGRAFEAGRTLGSMLAAAYSRDG
jgi:sugar phosphate isomerase/epimerase